MIEPSILDIVTRILLTYKHYIDANSKAKLNDLIHRIINEHTPVRHNFEISWALWIAKTFELEIDESSANCIIETKDCVANLILLDLIKTTTLVQGHPTLNVLETLLIDDALFSENWLLAYESVKKGWLTAANPNLLNHNLFFKLLKDLDVEFYETTKQLTPYHLKGKKANTSSTSYDKDTANENITSAPKSEEATVRNICIEQNQALEPATVIEQLMIPPIETEEDVTPSENEKLTNDANDMHFFRSIPSGLL